MLSALQREGFRVGVYHAGLSDTKRTDVHMQFLHDKLDVVRHCSTHQPLVQTQTLLAGWHVSQVCIELPSPSLDPPCRLWPPLPLAWASTRATSDWCTTTGRLRRWSRTTSRRGCPQACARLAPLATIMSAHPSIWNCCTGGAGRARWAAVPLHPAVESRRLGQE